MSTTHIPRQPQPQDAPKPVLCTEGTYVQKMAEAITFSENKRRDTSARGRFVGDKARDELLRRHARLHMDPPSEIDLGTKADSAVSTDDRWRTLIGDEQWGGRLATMYALAELVAGTREANELIRYQNGLMRLQLEEQRKTNELLSRLATRLAPQGGNL